MQLCLRRLCRSGLQRSAGLRKAQAIRMANGFVCLSGPVSGTAESRPSKPIEPQGVSVTGN